MRSKLFKNTTAIFDLNRELKGISVLYLKLPIRVLKYPISERVSNKIFCNYLRTSQIFIVHFSFDIIHQSFCHAKYIKPVLLCLCSHKNHCGFESFVLTTLCLYVF